MNFLSFLGLSVSELLTIVFLIITLIFLCKNKVKICIWITSILLFLNILVNWNTWFNVYILLKNILLR